MSTNDLLLAPSGSTGEHSRESSYVVFHVPDADTTRGASTALSSDELKALTTTPTTSNDQPSREGTKNSVEMQSFPSSPTASITGNTQNDDMKLKQTSSTMDLEGQTPPKKNCLDRTEGWNRGLFWSNCCFIVGIILFVIPLFLPAVVMVLMQQQICDKLCVPIPDEGATWVANLSNPDDWKINNFLTNSNNSWWPPEFFTVYLYHVNNSAAVLAGKASQLEVEAVGPYVFTTYREKYNVSFSPDYETIYYNQLVSYTFQPSMSNGHLLNETLTVVNMPLVSINWMEYTRANNTPTNFLTGFYCQFSPLTNCLFQTLPVSQILFSDAPLVYTSGARLLMKELAPTFQLFFNYSTNLTTANVQHLQNSFGMGGVVHTYLGSLYSFPPPTGSALQIFLNVTGTPSVNDSMLTAQYTGQGSSYSNLFGFSQYEGNTSLAVWDGPEDVSGTDHFQFAPPVTPESILSVWDDDVMRVVDLQFQEKVSVLDTYDAYRFTPTADLFSGTDPHFFGEEGYEGLLDVSPVSQIRYGASVSSYASRPYLAGVNSNLTATVNCTNCPDMSNEEDWLNVYVDIEPNTGKVLGGKKRGQINALVGQPYIYNSTGTLSKQYQDLTYKHLPLSLVPLVYFEYSSEIQFGNQTSQLDDGLNQVKLARVATATLFYLLLPLAAIAFLASFLIALRADEKGACCTSKPSYNIKTSA